MFSGRRIILYGFDVHTVSALRDLGAPPAVWLRKGDAKSDEAEELGTRIVNFGDVGFNRTEPVDPRGLDPAEIEQICNCLRENFRRSADRRTTYRPAWSWTTHESRMRLMVHYVANLLDRQRITCVFFHNIPHEAPGLALEAVCRVRGINVFITTQTPFPNRFLLFRSLDEFGSLEGAPYVNAPPAPTMPQKPVSPFYMQRKVIDTSSWNFQWDRIRLFAQFAARLALYPFTDRRRFYKIMHRTLFINQTHRLHTERYTDKPDLSRNFIYLPLHLQPELTVDVMGGKYGDQALVAENLSRAAPKDWLIYIKENPKQTADARDEAFFQRLSALPNVRLVSPKTDTFALIEACRCVATCTGTAGWEALLMGKPAIAFGAAWWRKLPGAFEWRDALDLKAVAESQFDRMTLEAGFNRLAKTMRSGVVNPVYSKLVEGFDARQNGQEVAAAIHDATIEEDATRLQRHNLLPIQAGVN